MDEDVRENPQQEEEQQDPRQQGKKPGVETWPVVPGGRPGAKEQTGNEEQ